MTTNRAVLSLLLCTLAWAGELVAGDFAGKVVAVADSDTVTILVAKEQIKVRLTDIDAPEHEQGHHDARPSCGKTYPGGRLTGGG
jgi:endonuclease YncB( thermonuclease family)